MPHPRPSRTQAAPPDPAPIRAQVPAALAPKPAPTPPRPSRADPRPSLRPPWRPNPRQPLRAQVCARLGVQTRANPSAPKSAPALASKPAPSPPRPSPRPPWRPNPRQPLRAQARAAAPDPALIRARARGPGSQVRASPPRSSPRPSCTNPTATARAQVRHFRIWGRGGGGCRRFVRRFGWYGSPNTGRFRRIHARYPPRFRACYPPRIHARYPPRFRACYPPRIPARDRHASVGDIRHASALMCLPPAGGVFSDISGFHMKKDRLREPTVDWSIAAQRCTNR
jgi:hypothetical protein